MGVSQFSLEPLLEQCRQRESLERELLDRVRAGLLAARDELLALERKFCENAAAARAADLDSRAVRLHYGCSERIVHQIEDARRRISSYDESARVAGQSFAQARALRETLETLKSRQLARRRQAEEQFEERELDEVNAAWMTGAERT